MSPTYAPLIGVAIALLILTLRMRRGAMTMPLKLERLWITPAIFIAMAGYLISVLPPHGGQWLWLAATATLGGVVGWYRGSMMRITVDPETHALNQQASPAALIFLGVLVLIRTGMRTLMAAEGKDWGIDASFITDVFLIFVVGMITIQRIEMALRARRLLDEAKASRAG